MRKLLQQICANKKNPDLKQQINFIGWLDRDNGATMFFSIEKLEETTFEILQNAVTVVWFNLVMSYIKWKLKRL